MNRFFGNLPIVTKNLLLINIVFFVVDLIFEYILKLNLSRYLGLFFFTSEEFRPLQIVTHMFMHGGFMHIIFNMYAVVMFGQVLERLWGAERFLIYYLVTAFGAALIHTIVNYFQFQSFVNQLDTQTIETIYREGYSLIQSRYNYKGVAGELNALVNIPVVGASGAVFGLLLAFGMLFPNTPLMIMFVPIPIKAKYFVIIYAVLELYLGLANRQGDNIAHFAHLGGLIFGFILIKFWNRKFR